MLTAAPRDDFLTRRLRRSRGAVLTSEGRRPERADKRSVLTSCQRQRAGEIAIAISP